MVKKKSNWSKIRKFLNDIHLWLGLASGIIVLLVCLSGTLYVFNTEFREMAAPHLYKVNPGSTKLSVEDLYDIVKKESKGNVSAVRIPYDETRSYAFTVRKKENSEGHDHKKSDRQAHAHSNEQKKEEASHRGERRENKTHLHQHQEGHSDRHKPSASDEHSKGKDAGKRGGNNQSERGRGGRGNQFMVNPYTGIVLGDQQGTKTATAEFMQKMFSLHRWLLLDKIEEPIIEGLENRKLGSYITGTATILFTLGVITGMIIWIPAKVRNWKQGLKIKTGGNWKRTNHDLHNTLGFYSCILLFIMGITGPQWSFEWYREGLRKTLGTHQQQKTTEREEKPQSVISESHSKPLSIEEIIAIADKELVYKGDYNIMFPADSMATINITKNKVGFFAPAAGDKLVLDQYSGAILEKEIFKEKPFNERVSNSIKALHIGDVYGMFSKILYFIACLIATSLPVTGVLIWINKMKKKPVKKTV